MGLNRKGFMNDKSKKLLERNLSKSNSQSTFLERNYYNKTTYGRGTSELGRSEARQRRDLSATNSYVRDMSGSKMSFLNSTSNTNALEGGPRFFSPAINERSRMMSPRDRETTFDMLHQQAINQQRKNQIKSYQADKNAATAANRGLHENVNKRSDAFLVKQFYQEFCQVIQGQIEESNQKK